VTAKSIEANSDVEIINSDLVIATLTDAKATLEVELTVERGRGYRPTEEREDESRDIGIIAVDALFSPVRNVGYRVENTRVGEITNFDKLIMSIETDGSITPEDAVRQASRALIDYFSILLQDAPAPVSDSGEKPATEEDLETEM